MNVFCIVLLALCPLSIGVNISVETALQDPLEEVEDVDVFSRLWKMNKHLLNRTDGRYVTQFLDIVIDTSKSLVQCKNCYWPKSPDGNVYIPYIFDNGYSKDQQSTIKAAVEQINYFTCLKFVARKKEKDYIRFESGGSRCQSFVGRLGGPQKVWVASPLCVTHKTVQHEVMHVLGFAHEQSRSDRDKYVKIFLENIKDEYRAHYRKEMTNNMGTPYDFTSIMHYSKSTFSKGGRPTMEALSDPTLDFSKTGLVTEIDLLKMNKFYSCKNVCGKLLHVTTGTFTSPNYPASYPKQSDCKWLIMVRRPLKILLEFTSYQIKPFKNCLRDHVTVHDGSDYNAPKLFGPDCGAEVPLVMSTSAELFIVFQSKASRASGFSVNYKPIPFCGEMKRENKGELRFQRPYSLYHAEQCNWIVLSPRQHKIIWTLTLMEFPSSESCTSGYLRVTDTAASAVKGTYCGVYLNNPQNITSIGRSLLVEYFHNTSGRRHRFRFAYEFVKNPNYTRIKNPIANEGSHHNHFGLLLCILLTYALA